MRSRLISRRRLFASSGVVVLLVLVGGGLSVASLGVPHLSAKGSRCARDFPPIIRDGFPEPPIRFSRHGVLDTVLRASVSRVRIAGQRYVTNNYDGSVPAPTLVFCPGDDVTVHFINDLKEPTNLHVHGLHVSPNANHDNVFLDIRPGEHFTYQYSIPLDQDPGAFWFHGHRHHYVAEQLYGGMAGAIVVEGGLDDLLAKIPQRIMVIQAMELCGSTGHSVPFGKSGSERCSTPGRPVPFLKSKTKYTPFLVNGALKPVLHIRPGQIQRWRIYNASPDTLIKLSLAGQQVEVLAQDGNTLRWMRPTRALLIAPGSRREILVRGARPGRYSLSTLPFSQFPDRKVKGQTLVTVISSGKRAADRMPKGPLASPIDLRRMRVDRYRRVIFSGERDPAGVRHKEFLLNDHAFDPNYVPITMKLNSVEQWTLVNTNTEWHTFHIHQNPFQVISVNGRPVKFIDYQDNVALPPKSRMVLRMRPTDFTGKFVFHCHVTFHEDRGMMMAVRVVRSPTHAELQASTGAVHGIAVSSSAYGASRLPPLPRAIVLLCHLLGVKLPGGLSTAPA